MALNYETLDSPYDSFMNRGAEQGASGTSDSLHSLNTAGSEGVPVGSGEGVETATNLGSSQVATTENTVGNGNTENMPTKDSGAISDLWINTFIKSSNWKPKKQGFWLDGPTGYAEFVNVYVSGNINALTGNIGGWIIETGLLSSAETGSRIELNSTKSRISIFDSTNEVVVMGYLDGLAKHGGSGNWGASNYGFWAKAGDMLSIDGDAEYVSGDWIIQNDASYLVNDASDNTIIRLGTDTGEKGLFIYDTSGTQLAKFISDEIFVGNDDESLRYTVSNGLEISDPIISDTLTSVDTISEGDFVAILAGGFIAKTNSVVIESGRNYGIAKNVATPAVIVSGGTGYSTQNVVSTTGGSGTGLTLNITATAGVITAVELSSPGSGYVKDDVVTVSGGGGNATIRVMPAVKVQKSGPYVTTGLIPGDFYEPSLTYGSEVITIEQSTKNAVYDASLGVGQTFTPQMLFMSRISLYLTAPAGTGSYPYKLRLLRLFTSEGGNQFGGTPVSVTSLTRSGSTVTGTVASTIGCEAGGYVYISGANEPEYNGTHRVLTAGTFGTPFTFSISTTPASPATGTITAYGRAVAAEYSGNVSITGTSENFLAFNLIQSSQYPTTIMYKENPTATKYLFEFTATNPGDLNIGYSTSSVYSGGSLWLSGVIDTGKDLGFRLRERYGGGDITNNEDATNYSMGLARSTTNLLLGKFI